MTQTFERQPGGLYVQTPDQERIAFPLKHTEVQATVTGNLSRVEVTQSFENPFTTRLEAVYIFPLPDEAAVDDMLIRIGDRTIQGSIKKRQEAQEIYEQAKRQGRTAGLLEQERDNIFTQSLANIQPGEQIDVIIRYTDSLKFVGGDYEFVFPMVVGPRYIPGTRIEDNTVGGGSAPYPLTQNQDTDLVPDASHLNAPILPPGTRSRHDINVTVEIDAGVEIRDLRSPSHLIHIERQGAIARVSLSGTDTIPNKDLILRYQVAGDRTQATVLTETDDRGGHFALYLIPALQYQPEQVVPKDVIFLIDTSGSQMGAPLMQCQELMRRFINGLNPNDTFSIIDFANTTRQFSPVPLPSTPQTRAQAIQYVNGLTANGGTELLRGIQTVLNFPVTNLERLRSIVLLTDGYIGNENQVLAEVQRNLKPGNRLYSFGAGSSVNRFLLNRIAEIGRGMARVVRHDESVEAVTETFFRQINNPVLTNIELRWEGEGEAPVLYPSVAPDLFAEQPLVLFGRKGDRQPGKLHITGMSAGGKRYQQTFPLNFDQAGNPAVAQLWGRARIKDLMNQMVSGEKKVGVEAVTDTALAYQLLSQYTAFVAVSDQVRVNPDWASVSVQVPVEMPEGVQHQGIFGQVGVGQAVYAPATMGGVAAPGGLRRKQSIARPSQTPEASLSDLELAWSSTEGWLDDFSLDLPVEELSPEENRAGFARVSDMSVEVSEGEEVELFSLSPANWEQGTPVNQLQVIQVTGLDQRAIALLTQHLQSAQLPTGFSGDLVFEFQVKQGRVRHVVLDEQASSLTEQTVIDEIRKLLLIWRSPTTIIGNVRIVLRVE